MKYLELKAQGRSINSELRKSKGYRNPDFLQKIVKHFDIKEQWSHFPTNVFDPTGYPPDDYFDKLGTFPLGTQVTGYLHILCSTCTFATGDNSRAATEQPFFCLYQGRA